MAKQYKKSQKTEARLQEYVTAAFTEDMEQAKNYEVLLKSNDIPAIIKQQDKDSDESMGKNIAVMVPEDFLDETHVIIESQDAYDDFYDFALESEGDGDFDDELLDDQL